MANWRKELRALSRKNPELGDEAENMNLAIHLTESDRGCALIAGSLAENSLQYIIRVRAFQLRQNEIDEIFGYEAPLGSFSAKVKVAHALGMIDNDLRSDFDRIREIRNAFAHSRVSITFRTPCVMRACEGFIAPLQNTPQEHIEKVGAARVAYVNTCYLLAHVSTLTMQDYSRGRRNKLRRTMSYAEAVASRDKLTQRSLRQRRASRLKGDKSKFLKDPPESFRE
jgi:hypothetical protein